MNDINLFQLFSTDLLQKPLIKINGRIVQVVGLVAESQGPDVRVDAKFVFATVLTS